MSSSWGVRNMARKKAPDKLAQEVSKAIAAGMSYGKWKAMQPPVTEEKGLAEGWKVCPYCGKRFKAKNGKKYCEDYCRIMAYSDKLREERTVKRDG
jgi:hypothetical protein